MNLSFHPFNYHFLLVGGGDIPSSGKDAFKFLTKYLATFSGEDAYTMAEAKEEAVCTIIEFVRATAMFQVCLTEF